MDVLHMKWTKEKMNWFRLFISLTYIILNIYLFIYIYMIRGRLVAEIRPKIINLNLNFQSYLWYIFKDYISLITHKFRQHCIYCFIFAHLHITTSLYEMCIVISNIFKIFFWLLNKSFEKLWFENSKEHIWNLTCKGLNSYI